MIALVYKETKAFRSYCSSHRLRADSMSWGSGSRAHCLPIKIYASDLSGRKENMDSYWAQMQGHHEKQRL